MGKTATLFLTYNRLDFTIYSLNALLFTDSNNIIIIDNGSTDGTVEFLRSRSTIGKNVHIVYNKENLGIAGAMNQFIGLTEGYKYLVKVDNDTIIPLDFYARMLPHMQNADIVQAKHPLLKETCPKGFDYWVKDMPAKGALRFNHFVGGSGIMFKRDLMSEIPQTEWKLYGWRKWQQDNQKVIKAFATDVEIGLLDMDENGAAYPAEYKEYYLETKRL